MKTLRFLTAAAALVMAAGAASAQPASGAGPGRGPGGSGPGAGMMGTGPMGPGMHRGMGGQSGMDYTPAWSMMNSQEREEHRARMGAMMNQQECATYRDEHHHMMSERAKEKGVAMPQQPRRDACAGLKR